MSQQDCANLCDQHGYSTQDLPSASRAQQSYQHPSVLENSSRQFADSQEFHSLNAPNPSGSGQDNQSGSNEFSNMMSDNTSNLESVRQIPRIIGQDQIEVMMNYDGQDVTLKNSLESLGVQI